jgi:hypothetical protein
MRSFSPDKSLTNDDSFRPTAPENVALRHEIRGEMSPTPFTRSIHNFS